MAVVRRFGLPLLLALGLAACAPPPPQLYQERIFVFGTLVDLGIWGAPPERAKAAADQVARDLHVMHRDWHPWEPGPLTELNAAIAAGQDYRVTPSLLPLIRVSLDLERRSHGLFDPGIGRLVALWGFHSDDIHKTKPPPDPGLVAELVAKRPSMEDLIIEGDRVGSRNPAVKLDFGAVAKGFAGDLVLARLRELGIEHALINLGGGLSALGRHGERPWRVGIRHPQGAGILGAVTLESGEAVHTSGNYERYNEYEGIKYSHIIDPRTGRPVTEIVSASVIAANGALADAAATALVVAGSRDWLEIARDLGIELAMLVDEQGTLYLTPGMLERVEFDQPPKSLVVKNLPGATPAGGSPR